MNSPDARRMRLTIVKRQGRQCLLLSVYIAKDCTVALIVNRITSAPTERSEANAESFVGLYLVLSPAVTQTKFGAVVKVVM